MTQQEILDRAVRHGWKFAGRNSGDRHVSREDKTRRSRNFLKGKQVLVLTVLRCGKIVVVK